MQHLNYANCRDLYQILDTFNQTGRLYHVDCHTTRRSSQPDAVFTEVSCAQYNLLPHVCAYSTTSIETSVSPEFEKEKKRAPFLTAPPHLFRKNVGSGLKHSRFAAELATLQVSQKRTEKGVSPLLSRSSLLEKPPHLRTLGKPRWYQGVVGCLPVSSSKTVVPTSIGKFINRLMRHGKKGIAIGLFARSLLLFFKRLQENKQIALAMRGAQLRISPPRKSISKKCVSVFPFYAVLSSPEETSKTEVLPSKALRNYPQNRGSTLHLDGGWRSHPLMMEKPSRLQEASRESARLSSWASHLHRDPVDAWKAITGVCSPLNHSWQRPTGLLYANLWREKGWRYTPSTNQNGGKEAPNEVEKSGSSMPPIKAGRLRSTPSLDNALCTRRLEPPHRVISQLPPRGGSAREMEGKPLLNFYGRSLLLHDGGVGDPSWSNNLAPRNHRNGPGMGLDPLGVSKINSNRTPGDSFVIDYLEISIANVEPSLEVRKKKIAGITRQIPSAVAKSRGERLAIRWLVDSAREKVRKRGKGLSECLADELIEAYTKRGEPRQKRDSVHRQAESNRSFMRYRWW